MTESKEMTNRLPSLNIESINDVIVGNATPEAEQGLNIGRMISLIGLNSVKVPGMTINRYCSSGLETISIGTAKIKAGMANCILAGGVEVMSKIPMGGWRVVPNHNIATTHPDWYWGMGTTAEAIVEKYGISRKDQDEFAYNSHMKAINAIKNNLFKDDIIPYTITETLLNNKEESNLKNVFDESTYLLNHMVKYQCHVFPNIRYQNSLEGHRVSYY